MVFSKSLNSWNAFLRTLFFSSLFFVGVCIFCWKNHTKIAFTIILILLTEQKTTVLILQLVFPENIHNKNAIFLLSWSNKMNIHIHTHTQNSNKIYLAIDFFVIQFASLCCRNLNTFHQQNGEIHKNFIAFFKFSRQ